MRPDHQRDRDHTPSVLMAEADAGDGEAAHHLALMSASGLARPRDWREALRRLDQAAELGHALARETAAFLGADPDIEAWLTPPAPKVLSKAPHVLSVAGFATAATCSWLVERARPWLKAAEVYDPEAGGATKNESRSNTSASFDILDCDLVMMLLRERIARATGLPVAGLEPVHILNYAVGQAFTPHYDWLDPDQPGHRTDLAERGQRTATFLLYLNDDYEGGETQMDAIGLRHRADRGDALFWANVRPDGRPDVATRHAGLAPTSGEKWVYSQWCRNRAPRSLTEG